MRSLLALALLIHLPLAYAQTKELTLSDLGISQADSVPDLQLQKDLEVRSHKLQRHQTWGLITQGLMTAALVTGGMAKDGDNELHQYLGMTAFATYWTTAYYSLTAPKPSSVKDQGTNIKLHKALAWVHGPLMILTPIAGLMASANNRHHKKNSGLAAQKGTLGTAAFAAYTLSMTLMFIEF